ncbi:hypothetical protein KBC79_00265 [Candidatus Woesebacteria bacterium]|nr:hypothetical protein [Candidatus Woesebacteria bacterium]
MKKILDHFFPLLILVVAVFTLKMTGVQAHVLEQSESIGAVLHIAPNDDPAAGENTTLIFEVTDTVGSFDPAQCNCSVQVLQSDTILTSTRIDGYDTALNAKTLYATVVFPEVGVYKVQLIGNPVTHDWFDSFTLSYDVRVVRQTESQNEQRIKGNALWFIIIAAGMGCIVWVLLSIRKKVSSGVTED